MLLLRGWFSVAKTIIPEAAGTFSSPHHTATLIFSVDWGLGSHANWGISRNTLRKDARSQPNPPIVVTTAVPADHRNRPSNGLTVSLDDDIQCGLTLI